MVHSGPGELVMGWTICHKEIFHFLHWSSCKISVCFLLSRSKSLELSVLFSFPIAVPCCKMLQIYTASCAFPWITPETCWSLQFSREKKPCCFIILILCVGLCEGAQVVWSRKQTPTWDFRKTESCIVQGLGACFQCNLVSPIYIMPPISH